MEVIEKPWGVTRCIHKSAACEVWHASIRASGVSSVHRHIHKANDFYVLSGRLLIEKDGITLAQLDAGEVHHVPAGEWHQFQAVTSVELIETYWLQPIDPGDIEREAESHRIFEVAHGV